MNSYFHLISSTLDRIKVHICLQYLLSKEISLTQLITRATHPAFQHGQIRALARIPLQVRILSLMNFIVLSDNESVKSGESSKSSLPYYGAQGRGGFFLPGNQRFYHNSNSHTDTDLYSNNVQTVNPDQNNNNLLSPTDQPHIQRSKSSNLIEVVKNQKTRKL